MLDSEDGGVEGGAGRIAAAVVLSLLAFPASFIFGNVYFGLVPIGLAVWLVAAAPWRRRVRVGVSIALVAAAIAVLILMLSQLHFN